MEIKASVIRSVLIGRCRFVILKSISDPLSKEKKILFLSLALSLSLFLHPEFPGFFSLPAFLCASHFSLFLSPLYNRHPRKQKLFTAHNDRRIRLRVPWTELIDGAERYGWRACWNS